MKIFFTMIVAVWFTTVTNGQIYVSPGATLNLSGNAQVTLDNTDLINDGTVTSSPGCRIIFNGSSNNSISGTSSIAFADMEIAKSGSGILYLQSDIRVSGGIYFTSNLIDLNQHNIDLGTTGTLMGESESSRITGVNGGEVKITANLNAPSAVNPGNIGIAVSSNANLGNTIIERGHVQQTGGNNGVSINRYFDITPANNSALNATLKMYYFDAELAGVSESDLNLFSSEDNGSTWSLAGVDNADQSNDWVAKGGLTHLSRWTLASMQKPLPVNLISFNATLVNRTTHLKWTTAQELNTARFDVQRSANGTDFNTLFSIPAHGNTNTTDNYHAVDQYPMTGINYYRLKEVDKNDTYTYSSIVHVDMKSTETCWVFPNPVSGIFNLYLTLPEATKNMVIGLYDMNGKLLQQKEINHEAGEVSIEWNIGTLAKGTYLLRNTDNRMPVIKVIKQ